MREDTRQMAILSTFKTIALNANQEIGRFDITMNNAMIMGILER